MAARAMQEIVSSAQSLRTITAVFANRVVPGPVTIDSAILRAGRSATQATAEVYSDGQDAGLTATAVFGVSRRGFVFTDTRPPDVPPPCKCPSFRDESAEGVVSGSAPLWDRIEGRTALGHHPAERYQPTTSEQAHWYRFDEPPLLDNGFLDPLALLVLSDTMLGSISERMGPGMPAWFAPSADLTVRLFGEVRSEWLLAHHRAVHAQNGYVSLSQELWDPPHLVAQATQLAFVSFPEDVPAADLHAPS